MRRFATVLAAFALAGCTSVAAPDAWGPTVRPRPSAAASVVRSGTPTASPDDGDVASYPTVGALFDGGVHGVHSCTASVVASTSGNTVLTAAHCVSGTGAGVVFVPAYRRGAAPEGVWTVTHAYVSEAWQRDLDPQHDYAVLTVASRQVGGRTVALASVGGSEQLGTAVPPGTQVTLVAYNRGSGDLPVYCRAPVYLHDGFDTVDCHGFSGGSSGSPWLTTSDSGQLVARGVIGGENQGGCRESTSETAAFTADVDALVRRAQTAAPADSVRPAGADGC